MTFISKTQHIILSDIDRFQTQITEQKDEEDSNFQDLDPAEYIAFLREILKKEMIKPRKLTDYNHCNLNKLDDIIEELEQEIHNLQKAMILSEHKEYKLAKDHEFWTGLDVVTYIIGLDPNKFDKYAIPLLENVEQLKINGSYLEFIDSDVLEALGISDSIHRSYITKQIKVLTKKKVETNKMIKIENNYD